MAHSRAAGCLVALALVLVLPVSGRAGGKWFDCQGSACAAASADTVGARVDWEGGNLEVGRRAGKYLPGGASVQDYTDDWLSIWLYDPQTGQQYFSCWRELPSDAFTLNADGSATLSYTADPGCGANVSWTPIADEAPRVYWWGGGDFDLNTASGSTNMDLYVGRPSIATGWAQGGPINSGYYADTHSNYGGCAANQSCGF